ncbi:AraC family transcriptional regulator [Bacillus gobiensis]|uniref:AraC family transcriptional regulator n=2 Tax=Bacillus gobiensis TaxID=1441095 RepID=UPI003D1C3024
METNQAHPNKGILNKKTGDLKYTLLRHTPSEDLHFFIQRYWTVNWDLRGQAPYRQKILSHPCVNMVFEKGDSRIYGISKETSSHLLKDEGQVFGIKFKPGGFYPFINFPVSHLTNRSLPIEEVFGTTVKKVEDELFSLEGEDMRIQLVENFFREHLPERNKNAELTTQIAEHIAANREITKVEQLAHMFKINKRKLQRIFNQFVGVSPKWVIKRARLHEAAELAEKGKRPDWSQLALELGYYDQSHFIKDFKRVIGKSPKEYGKI